MPSTSSSSPQPDRTRLALTRSRFRLSLGNRRAPLWNEPSLAAPTRQPAPHTTRAEIGMGRTPLLPPPRSPPDLRTPRSLDRRNRDTCSPPSALRYRQSPTSPQSFVVQNIQICREIPFHH